MNKYNILKKSNSYDSYVNSKLKINIIKSKSFNDFSNLNYFIDNKYCVKIPRKRRDRDYIIMSNSPTIDNAMDIIKKCSNKISNFS